MKFLCLSYDYVTIFDIFLQFIVTSLSFFFRPIRLILNFEKTRTSFAHHQFFRCPISKENSHPDSGIDFFSGNIITA